MSKIKVVKAFPEERVCHFCGRYLCALYPGETFERDHIIPRYHGGRFIENNTVFLCSTCHKLKTMMVASLDRLKKYREAKMIEIRILDDKGRPIKGKGVWKEEENDS